MNNETHKKNFDRDGYVVVPQFLPSDEWDELTGNIDRYIRQVVPTLSDESVYYQDRDRPETIRQLEHMKQDPYFNAYQRHPRWLALAQMLLDEPVEIENPKWFNKPPGAVHPTPPHQDNYYFCLEPPKVITMWIAMDKVDDENGCLRYVVGSHREGIRKHGASDILGFSQGIVDFGPNDQAREMAPQLQYGDLVVHHGETIHRADPNRSETRSRRAFAMVARGQNCCINEQRHAAYLAARDAQHQAKGIQS